MKKKELINKLNKCNIKLLDTQESKLNELKKLNNNLTINNIKLIYILYSYKFYNYNIKSCDIFLNDDIQYILNFIILKIQDIKHNIEYKNSSKLIKMLLEV